MQQLYRVTQFAAFKPLFFTLGRYTPTPLDAEAQAVAALPWTSMPMKLTPDELKMMTDVIRICHRFVKRAAPYLQFHAANPEAPVEVTSGLSWRGDESDNVSRFDLLTSGISLSGNCLIVLSPSYRSAVSQRDMQRAFKAIRFFWSHAMRRDPNNPVIAEIDAREHFRFALR